MLAKNADDLRLIAKHDFFRHLVEEASASVPLLLPVANLLCTAPAVEAIRAECTPRRGLVEVSIRPQIAALVVSRQLRKRTGGIRAVRVYWDGERVTRAFLFAREAHNC